MLLTTNAKKEMLDTAKAMAATMVEELRSELIAEVIGLNAKAAIEMEANIQNLFVKALEADRAKRYDSNEPFVEILSQKFSEEGGVQLRLDWNQPFINYLKTNGFTGPTDEAIVDNWLVSLSRERIAEGGSEYK